MKRTRRSWTSKEDELLRKLVQTALDTSHTVLWSELAQKVPGRSNKDCRKRWWNTLAGGNIKGAWSPEEDQRLSEAVREHGNNWTQIAALVGSRCADQCSSHWRQVLRPNVSYCNWTEQEVISRSVYFVPSSTANAKSEGEQDEELLKAVQTHGTNWSTIAAFHHPPRTGLGLKNRYARIRAKDKDAGRSVLHKGPSAPGGKRSKVVKPRRKRSSPQIGIAPDCDEQMRGGSTPDNCPGTLEPQGRFPHPDERKEPACWWTRSPNNTPIGYWETSTSWVGHGTIDPRLILPSPPGSEDCWMNSTPDLTVSAMGNSRLPSFDRVLDATQADNDRDRQMLLFPPDEYPTDMSFRTVHEALYLAPDPCSLGNSRHSSTEPLHPFLTMAELDLMPREPSPRALFPGTNPSHHERTAETNMHRVSLSLSCTTSQLSSIMSRVADTGAAVNMTVDTE